MAYIWSSGERCYIGKTTDTKPMGYKNEKLIEIDTLKDIKNVYIHNGSSWLYRGTTENYEEQGVDIFARTMSESLFQEATSLQKSWTPQNYMKSKGICIEDCIYPSDWLIPTSGITKVYRDENLKCFESGAIRFDMTPSGWKAATRAINIDMTNNTTILIPVWIEDQFSLNYVKFRLTQDATKLNAENNWTVYMETADIYTSTKLHTGWNIIKLHKNDFTAVGGETWGNFKALRLIPGVPTNKFDNAFSGNTGAAITSTSIAIGGIYVDSTHETSKILLNFDDSQVSFFTKGWPILRQRGILSTMFLCREHMSDYSAAYATPAVHDLYYAAGNDVCNHSTTHGDMWYMTKDQIKWEFGNCLSYLLSRGYTRSAMFGAFPKNEVNKTAMEAVQELGYKMVRGRNVGHIDYVTTDDILQFPTYEIKGTTTWATIQGWIDKAIERGVDISIFTHAIVDSGPDAYSTTVTILTQLADYIVTKRAAGLLEPVTVSQYYNGLTDKDITVPNIITTAA